MIFYRRDFGWSKMYHPVISTVFLFIFGHLNGILSQHGAVQLHWRKGQFLKRCNQVSGLEECIWMWFGVKTLAMSLFLILAASVNCFPLIHSVARLDEKMDHFWLIVST